jgi:hypothetical protein
LITNAIWCPCREREATYVTEPPQDDDRPAGPVRNGAFDPCQRGTKHNRDEANEGCAESDYDKLCAPPPCEFRYGKFDKVEVNAIRCNLPLMLVSRVVEHLGP